MKSIFAVFFVYLFLTFNVLAQQSLSPEAIFAIKREAFSHSQIESLAFYLTDLAGPRLAGSKLAERAEILVKERLDEMGFSNVRIEFAAEFAQGGWDNFKTYAAMTAPYYANFAALPKAWTGSTNGMVAGEVILLNINTEADFERYRGTLADKIVLLPDFSRYVMQFTPLASRYTDEQLQELAIDPRSQPSSARNRQSLTFSFSGWRLQQQISDFLAEEKPAVIISSGGEFNVPETTSVSHKYGQSEPIAELVLPIEEHGRMSRLMFNNVTVEMEVEIKNEFYDNMVINNVIAEIPGTDSRLRNETVLIGAHWDSWHGGTGAADNAAGCIVMIEAMRIIKATGIQPRRTIRLALWGGEELGLLGSRGYLQNNLYDTNTRTPKTGYQQFALYLNMDNGSGKFRGIYLEENDMAFPFFREWIKPLETLSFGVLSPRKTDRTDHVTFDRIGLPAFQFIQDELEYMRSYHTVMDTYERLIISDLRYNAAIVAALALSAAMDNDKIPPKPLLEGVPAKRR